LHLVVTTSTVIETGTTNSINFIEEDDASLLCAGHLEELTNHTGTLTNVLLHQLRTNDTNESGVCSVGDSSGAKSLTGSGRTVEKGTLGRVDTQVDEAFW